MKRVLATALAAALVSSFFAGSAGAQPAMDGAAAQGRRAVGDAKPLPKFVKKWQANKETAADLVARGLARPNRRGVVRLPNGQFVDYALEDTDHIVTILADFSDPRHGEIEEPDRSVDNSRYWIPSFNRGHYRQMLFKPGGGNYGNPSMRDSYLELSSGRYTVKGQVSRWVHIDEAESAYGANGPSGDGSDNLNGPVYRVVKAALKATKGNVEDVDWSPSKVDSWDRYDCDGDGNFDEPDGYVDHFQLVHAGEGEEADGGAQGGDAIWSHRWYAGQGGIFVTGPKGCPLGGYRVPGTKLWVGDYTIEPEDGATGVFTHEFGHDLGLPDLYDVVGANDNSTDFWALMASSWPSDSENAIGDHPYHMGAWEKLVLGWMDLAEMNPGDTGKVVIGPAEGANTTGVQALRVRLPNYMRTEVIFAPEGGDPNYYYSDMGDAIQTTMSRSLGAALAAPGTLEFRANFDIETDWDYAYVEYSTNNGATWQNASGNLSTNADPNGQNEGNGITGTSGSWVDGTYTLPAGTTDIGFRYWTDGAVVQKGLAVDSIQVNGGAVDDATDPSAWTFNGFSVLTDGEVTTDNFHYYLVESRSYVRSDSSLCGVYQFLDGDWLEKWCNADGLLVWYRDGGYADNNVSVHPGHGQVLVVDSHPEAVVQPGTGGDRWRERMQAWDATFGLDDHSITVHYWKGYELKPFQWDATAVSVFNDNMRGRYYDPASPYASVITPGSGLRIKILKVSPNRTTYKVRVSWAV
jgi:immune inhibitor A